MISCPMHKSLFGGLVDVKTMRARLADVYRAEKWRKKVAQMTDNQVIAVYRRMVNDKKI